MALNRVGSAAGQLLRQMRELKSAAYNRNAPYAVRAGNIRGAMRTIIMTYFDKMGYTMTEDQVNELERLINTYASAHVSEFEWQKKFLESDPSQNKALFDSNKKRFEAATELVEESLGAIEMFMENNVPAGFREKTKAILKGNLLTVSSIVINVGSNIANAANTGLVEGQVMPAVRSITGQGKSGSTASQSAKATALASATFLKLLWSSVTEAFRRGGMKPKDMGKFEVMRHVNPHVALGQIYRELAGKSGGLPKKLMLKDGKTVAETPVSVWAEKVLEGTFGWPAAFFFRVLYATDKPFKEAAKVFAATQMLGEQNNNSETKVPLTGANVLKYIINADELTIKKLDKYAEKFAYSDSKTMSAKMTNGFLNKIFTEPAKSLEDAGLKPVGAMWDALGTSITPFATVHPT